MHKNKRNIFAKYIFLNVNGILMIVLTYLFYKISNGIEGFGSSIILLLLMVGGLFLANVTKSLSLELSLTPLIIAGFIGINYLGYLETKIGFLNMNSLIFIGCIVWILFWFSRVLFILIKPMESLDEPHLHLRKQLTLAVMPSFIISITFIAITYVTFLNLQRYEPGYLQGRSNPTLFTYTTISTGLFIVALFVSLIYLLKIDDNGLKKLIIGGKCNLIKFNVNRIKRYFIIVFSTIIFMGSILEAQRGMWIMWIETILLLGLMSLIIWKIYKHIFYVKGK